MATVLDELLVRVGPEFVGQGELRKLESGIERAQRRLDSFASAAFKIGAALTTAATGTVVAFARYEAAIAKIEGLVGIGRDQLQAWQGDIRDIAAETGQGPEQLAEALFFVTSAGLRGSVAMDVLRASAKAAAAGLGEQADIVDLVTSAINAYGAENLSAMAATDGLTEAVRIGKLEPASLGAAMGRALPVAAAMGVQFSEVAGMLAAMSRTGTNAEEGVTQLNAVMSGLLKPTDAAEKALAAAGLSAQGLRDVAAGPQGLWGVLQMLKQAFGDNVDQMAEVFPNIRALRGVFDLLGPGMATNAALLEEMRSSVGVTDEAFQASADTLMHMWRQAVATAKFILIDLGQALRPVAERVIAFAQTWLAWFQTLPEGTKALVAQVLALGPALIAAGVAAKGLSIALGGLAPAAAVIAWIGRVTRITAAAQWAWNAALAAGPGSIAAIGRAFAAIRGLTLTGMLAGLKAAGIGIFASIKAAGVGAFVAVKGAALGVLASIKGLTLAGLWAGLKAAGVAAFAAIKAAALALAIPLAKFLLPLIAIAAILIAAWRPVSTFFVGLWSGVVGNLGLVSEAFGRLLDALGPVGGAVRGIFGGLREAFGWLASLLPDLTADGESFGAAIVRGIAAAIDAVTSIIQFFDGLSLYEAGVKLLRTLVDGIRSTAGLAKEAVLSALSGIRDLLPFSDAREGPLSRLTHAGRAVVTTLAEGVRAAPPLKDALLAGALTLPPLGVNLPALPTMPQLTAQLGLPTAPTLGVPNLPQLAVPDFDALAPPLPVGPVPPPAAAGSTTLTVSLAEGAITINAPGGDTDEIATRLREELGGNMWRGLAEQMDSRIKA